MENESGAKKENTEKQDKKKDSKKTESKGLPVYFVALLVILAFVAGLALFTLIKQPEPLKPITTTDQNSFEGLTGYFIYSKDCNICDKGNSLIDFLQENKIDNRFEKIEINSDKAKSFLDKIPKNLMETQLLLIDILSIKDKMTFESEGQKMRLIDGLYNNPFEKVENFFIIPETNFDQKGHTIMLLGKNCGSVSNPVVYIFEDPYSEECIKSKPLEIGLKEKIDSNVTFENFYISSLDATAQIAETYGNERTSAIFNYFSCVNVMGKIIDFEKKAYEIYCNTELKSNDPNFLEECKKSPNYGIPLSEIELQQIVLDQNINKQDINTCLSGAKDILGGSKYVANQFNISSVPTVVVNCKYKGHINSLKEMLCEINPKLNICTASK